MSNIWHWGAGIIVALSLVLGVIAWQQWRAISSQPVIELADDTPSLNRVDTSLPEPKNAEHQLVDEVDLWIPSIEKVGYNSPWPRLIWPLMLFLSAGTGFFWLLHHAIQRIQVRERKPLDISQRNGRIFLPPMGEKPAYHLLNGQARREMCWGVSHYLSGIPLNKLDVPRTVVATAKNALPTIQFLSAHKEREVWLWQDSGSDNPDLGLLANEITKALQEVSIFVNRGYFNGLPMEVRNPQGEIVWSVQHEHPEKRPLVVILVDSNSLKLLGVPFVDEGHITFRQLEHWPHLCLVDCSQQAGELRHLVKPYELICLLPQEVSAWFAQQGEIQKTESITCSVDALHQWAIACALPGRVLTEDEVRTIHDVLGLDCAWQFHALEKYARFTGNGLDFGSTYREGTIRRELLQEFSSLAHTEPVFAHKVVAFWLRRNHEINAALIKSETTLFPWNKTLRQKQLELESALLELWLPALEKI